MPAGNSLNGKKWIPGRIARHLWFFLGGQSMLSSSFSQWELSRISRRLTMAPSGWPSKTSYCTTEVCAWALDLAGFSWVSPRKSRKIHNTVERLWDELVCVWLCVCVCGFVCLWRFPKMEGTPSYHPLWLDFSIINFPFWGTPRHPPLVEPPPIKPSLHGRYICRVFDEEWKRVTVTSEWRGETAGGAAVPGEFTSLQYWGANSRYIPGIYCHPPQLYKPHHLGQEPEKFPDLVISIGYSGNCDHWAAIWHFNWGHSTMVRRWDLSILKLILVCINRCGGGQLEP